MRNPIDAVVGWISPVAGLRRAQARRVIAYYEAAKPSRLRKFRRDQAGPNVQTQQAAVAIRTQARHADQNHDIARGILDILVNNTIGPKGIEVEPQPRIADGSIHREYARDLLRAWRAWTHRPEVTAQHNWGQVQRLLARTWYRDGEAFGQMLSGPIPTLEHGSRVPLSIEMLEPDMIPYDYNDLSRGIRQGIQVNAWGRPRGYWVYKQHPHDSLSGSLSGSRDLKFVSADRIFHSSVVDRIGQLRGVSIFASVINRLDDIKDYEESERVAAKISAMLTAYVKRNSPDGVDPDSLPRDEDGNVLPREISLEPGAIIDTLQVGEEIDMIDSKRPNPNLVGFRHGQLKALAAGTRTTASSISKTYDGSYSAQRQEMVENWANYASLADEFVGDVVQPVWQAFVRAAWHSGVVPRPADVSEDDMDDALFLAQSMPWIDPLKEARAWHELVRDGFASEVEVIRKRGANPSDVLEQIISWRERTSEAGLTLSSNACPVQASQADPDADKPAAAAHRQFIHALQAMDSRHDEQLIELRGSSDDEIDSALDEMAIERRALIARYAD